MRFQLRALRPDGSLAILDLEAADEDAARLQASAAGLEPIALRRRRLARPPARLDLPLFCDQTLTLLAAGISLRDAMETLAAQETRADIGALLAAIAQGLRQGQALSQTLAAQPSHFPPLLVAMLRAAERSSALEDALGRYANFHRQVDALRSQLLAALAYPAMLLGAGSLVILFLLFHVVPRFAQIYNDMHGPLPWAAQLLLVWGSFVHDHGVLALGLIGGLGSALVAPIAHAPWRQRLLAHAARLPRLGAWLRLVDLARAYRSLGLLLRAGIPLPAAMDLVADLLPATARQQLAAAQAEVRQGRRLSQALADHGLATPVASRLVQAGERSGQLGEMLEQAAAFHDDEIARATELASKLLGPVLMLLMGLFIGGVVILLYLPIFQLAEGLG